MPLYWAGVPEPKKGKTMPTTTKVFFANDDPDAEFPYRKAIIRPADLQFFLDLGAYENELEATAVTKSNLETEAEPTSEKEVFEV